MYNNGFKPHYKETLTLNLHYKNDSLQSKLLQVLLTYAKCPGHGWGPVFPHDVLIQQDKECKSLNQKQVLNLIIGSHGYVQLPTEV